MKYVGDAISIAILVLLVIMIIASVKVFFLDKRNKS